MIFTNECIVFLISEKEFTHLKNGASNRLSNLNLIILIGRSFLYIQSKVCIGEVCGRNAVGTNTITLVDKRPTLCISLSYSITFEVCSIHLPIHPITLWTSTCIITSNELIIEGFQVLGNLEDTCCGITCGKVGYTPLGGSITIDKGCKTFFVVCTICAFYANI